MVGRNIRTLDWEFIRPRVRASTVWCLRPHEWKTHRLHSFEDGGIPRTPVGAALLAVAMKDVEVASGKNAMAFLSSNKHC